MICAILSCLIDITEVKYIELIVKNFLIQDYDKNLASNPQNMIAVLNQMLDNTIQKEEESKTEIPYYNLTNPIFVELIQTLVNHFLVCHSESTETSNDKYL